MCIISDQLFSILVTNFSRCEVRLLKHIKIAEPAKLFSTVHAINTDDRDAASIRTSEASTNFRFNASDRKVNIQTYQRTTMSAVHYKAAESQNSHNSHLNALNEASLHNLQDWKKYVRLSDKYLQYHDVFVDILSEFQPI